MVDLRPYEKLHTIVMLKDIIRKWWGVELALTDSRGYVLEHAEGRIIPPENDFCRLALFSKEGFRRCNESVKAVRDRLRNLSRRRVIVHECHMGFDVIAAPIVIEGDLAGFVFVGGSMRDEPSMVQRTELLKKIKEVTRPGDLDAARAKIPRLFGAELEHLTDLLEFAAREIAEYHQQRVSTERELNQASRELSERYKFDNIIGKSRPMQEAFRLLEKIVESDSTVLVNGESGTGKELVARAIHYNGPRSKKPFVVQNCSAFNDNLLESALFGHVKGAFTGAVRDKKGLFEIADGGTFFLDEIGDMSPTLQVKLLRVLQEGTFTPVGSNEVREVDVRVIAATHKDLQKMVEQGQFREDLYYRINVIRIVVPPLRERMDDLPLLVDHFLEKHSRGGKPRRVSRQALACMQRYAWPGNIRELENEIERMLVLGGDEEELSPDLLSPRVREADGPLARAGAARGAPPAGTLKEAIESVEKDMIHQGLIRTHWNKSQLAKELGISRSNLIQKCAYYGLDQRKP